MCGLFAISSALQEAIAGADTCSQLLRNSSHLDYVIGGGEPVAGNGCHPAGKRVVQGAQSLVERSLGSRDPAPCIFTGSNGIAVVLLGRFVVGFGLAL